MNARAASSFVSMVTIALTLLAGVVAMTTDNRRTASMAFAAGFLLIALSLAASITLIISGAWP
ncbi:hypothetical protein EOD42_22275 [Rhodovarius crocodyli]|uniref:Uncharacterized protein n=1 Tax=Rhodovarius crocodyli TaxID=1979269 RepID=A0A437M1I7_9PROT|nr:hypothetical protein [Rhodovarius crocodyli]RVT91384.1 hypothetical protein EOD42_22275 [Rhodovarius crocodyli]